MERIAVIGAGSWGTALAKLLAEKGNDVLLWAYEPEVADAINREHRNLLYLPETELPATLRATPDAPEAVEGRSYVISVVPSKALRNVWSGLASHLATEAVVVSCTKGIEAAGLKLMSEVLDECLPDHPAANRTVLSGPSFAKEVARHLPTSVVIAGSDAQVRRRVQELFRTPMFLTFTHDDVVGVEVGGAVKNVLAIATGMADGLMLGHNARATSITRGLYEMIKIGQALGASPLTFMGLSGIGDLVLTCTGELSRNRTVGLELGRGRSLAEIQSEMRTVAEGVPTAEAVHKFSLERHIELPICERTYRVMYEGLSPHQALLELCALPLNAELGSIMRAQRVS
jgi:glycerol-3-phosphate dehydrogenase (NAD(P)+)